MFKYLVFAYAQHYPHGGMEDCTLKTNDYAAAVHEAQALAEDDEARLDTVQIYDTIQARLVHNWQREE